MRPDKSGAGGQGMGGMEGREGAQDTVTNHCQHHRPRVTVGDTVGGDSGASLG